MAVVDCMATITLPDPWPRLVRFGRWLQDPRSPPYLGDVCVWCMVYERRGDGNYGHTLRGRVDGKRVCGVWVYGVWVYGVWVYGVWVYGVWVYGVWVYGVWVYGVWVYGVWVYGVCVWSVGVWSVGVWSVGVCVYKCMEYASCMV
jgi:hypothetical protein